MTAAISHSDVINLGMRMVVRVRHEFGCSINVMNLLHDQAYARSVIEMARRSTSEQLREQGAYLERMIMGPRDSSSPAVAQQGPAAAPSAAAQEDAERHRAAVLHKYKVGLR
ncbi:MAG: hypothetical protein AB7P37_17550 [Ramlibacter sp.]